jgi:phenylacetate-coenzyme A ligase PaaK-like adenylate-forming protein
VSLTTRPKTDRRGTIALARQLLARDGWTREELTAHRHHRLRELIRHAVAASPYYREVLGPDCREEELELQQLPTLSKARLMEEFDRIVTDPRLRLENVDAHVAGPDPAELLLGEYHVFTTSGTTGRRGVFVQTEAEFRTWVAAAWRAFLRFGAEADAKIVGVPAPTPLHITRKLLSALEGGRGPDVAVTTPLPEIVAALNRSQPDVFLTVSGLGGTLAEEQLQGRLGIEPSCVVLSGEVVTDDTRRRIREAWGSEPCEAYSTTEALIMATPSPGVPGLHVSEDLLVLEVVDELDRPVPPGVSGRKVLVTSFVGRAQPLIRYEISDTVTLAADPDPSGRPYTRIARVDGRSDDVLRLPALDGGEAAVVPYRLRAPFTHLPEVVQYHIVYDGVRVAVRVVLRPGAAAELPARIAAAMRAALEDAGAVPPPVDVEPVAAIERPAQGGKLRVVEFRPGSRTA